MKVTSSYFILGCNFIAILSFILLFHFYAFPKYTQPSDPDPINYSRTKLLSG